MTDTWTSVVLGVLTLLALGGWGLAVHRLRQPGRHPIAGPAQQWVVGAITVATSGLFGYRWLVVHGAWQPLTAHVDGLLLIGAMVAGTILFLQNRPRLFGLSAFAMPILALVLGWAVCAATWTYRPFDIDTLHPVWNFVHLAGVYVGTVFSALAAIAGGMFLYVQGRVKQKQNLSSVGRLASLESLEGMLIRVATLGFVLLTLGLVSGLVILVDDPPMVGLTGWYAFKIGMAVLAWGVYAVLMNVRYASSFRGARAAWLAICGLVLLLVTYAVVAALPMLGAGPVEAEAAERAAVVPGEASGSRAVCAAEGPLAWREEVRRCAS